ncbi:MAG: hypothetical protein E6Y12_10455 [Dermabacter sp.]|nr:hypothetical protein [Dermabacter sp.]
MLTTETRELSTGHLHASRGNRELYIIIRDGSTIERGRELLTKYSFNQLYTAGKKDRLMPHTSTIYLRK